MKEIYAMVNEGYPLMTSAFMDSMTAQVWACRSLHAVDEGL